MDLILRKSSLAEKTYRLDLRDHGPVETEYTFIANVTEKIALEIEEAGAPFFLYGHPYGVVRGTPKPQSTLLSDQTFSEIDSTKSIILEEKLSVPETVFTSEQLEAWGILTHFSYGHLKPELQTISREFAKLALIIIQTTKKGAEQSTALRKLLECKDAAVRAKIEQLKFEGVMK